MWNFTSERFSWQGGFSLKFRCSTGHRTRCEDFFRERGFHPGKSYLCWGNLAGYPSQQQVQCTEDGQCENRNDEEEAGIAGSMEDLEDWFPDLIVNIQKFQNAQ